MTSVSLSGSLASSTDDSNTTKHWDIDAGRELEAAPPSSLAEALARRGVRVPLGHVELWTDGSLAHAEPPTGLVVGARAVVWDGDQHVHILVLEGSDTGNGRSSDGALSSRPLQRHRPPSPPHLIPPPSSSAAGCPCSRLGGALSIVARKGTLYKPTRHSPTFTEASGS